MEKTERPMERDPRAVILSVDDSEAGRYAVSRILRREGFEILEAATGGQALEMVRRGPDLVLLDVNLPDLNGFEVCRRIKADPVTAAIPVLHLSAAYVDGEAKARGLDSGADGYLTQPVEPRVLAAYVRALLRTRRAEEELRRSEERSRTVADYTYHWEYWIGPEGNFLFVSPSCERVTGYPRETLLKDPSFIEKMIHPRDLPAWESHRERSALRASSASVEFRVIRRDGEVRWIEHVCQSVFGREGKFLGRRASNIDVTERKRAEEDLRRSEEKYRTLVENAGDAIFIAQDQEVKFANRKAREMLGYTAEELFRIPLAEHVHPDDREAVARSYENQLRSTEDGGPFSFRATTKSGGRIWVEMNSVLIDWEGKPAALSFARDLSEHKLLEERFLHAQKMEALGQLAGGLAHDFNNALTLISVCAQLALLELDPNHPVREKVEKIHQATERSAGLSRQLLAFSRRQSVEIKSLDLSLILKDLEKMLRRMIGEDIELTTSFQEGLGLVRADPAQIEQIVLNLAINARDAMPKGGTLAIETSPAGPDPVLIPGGPDLPAGRYVVLSVSDTGAGMTPEVCRRIFEPFFTTKERGKGTGLGLSTVLGIVKQSGGHIRVDSQPGAGTAFRIYFPRADELPAEREAKAPSEPSLPRGRESILVAEDEAPIRALVAQVLRQQGYRVLEASGGGEAFLAAGKSAGPIDLLLTDVIMPGLSGPDLAGRLQALYPRMKVLYMSGYPDEAIAPHGVLNEGVSLLHKPFTIDGLLAKVRDALGPESGGPTGTESVSAR